ncbi:hypothetical protein ACE6H2_005384 [Prunus campanulata]
MQNLTERLSPPVGLKGWDYCVIWKLSEDQRDTMQHSRTNSCDLLAQLPSSLSLDSGYLYILFILAFLFTHSIIITNYHTYLDKRN